MASRTSAAGARGDVRTRILEAALALVLDTGPAALTQPRIAVAAGVRQSHLTYYFPTRVALLQAVVQHMMEALLRGVGEQAAAAGRDGRRGLARALGNVVSDPRRARLMLALVVASEETPSAKVWLREFVLRLRQRLAGVLEAVGLDGGRVAELHATLVGAAILNVARHDAVSRREARAAVRAALLAFAPVRPGVHPRTGGR